ncbi:hypothetical protein Taro_004777 [Colocasia esculenta]|uniref:DUF4228 domain-containing protein n=1 Tax=Colocasia esculenta TaxID=4460 RepID=A0A843TSK9_COLES|nr:hypothetical protein [Colocasia esculenta]
MGNSFSPCISSPVDMVLLVFWGGATRLLCESQHAGQLMFEFPDHLVCRADSFYIGQPVPALSADDDLHPGNTYFVIPVKRLPSRVLTLASLSTLSAGPRRSPIDFGGRCPFQYGNGADGRKLIKVVPEFIRRIISEGSSRRCSGSRSDGGSGGGCGQAGSSKALCTTPELQRHYAQLVGAAKGQQWSPKLETISERKAARLPPNRGLGLDRRRMPA